MCSGIMWQLSSTYTKYIINFPMYRVYVCMLARMFVYRESMNIHIKACL